MAIDNVVLTYVVSHSDQFIGTVKTTVSISQQPKTQPQKGIPLSVKAESLDLTVDEDHSNDIAEISLPYSRVYHGEEYKGRIWADVLCKAGTFSQREDWDIIKRLAKAMLKEAIIEYEKSPYYKHTPA